MKPTGFDHIFTALTSTFYWTRIVAATVGVIGFCELRTALTPRDERPEKYTRLMRYWGKGFLLGNQLSISGAGHIPRGGGIIFASNHQSNFDIPLYHALLPVAFRWMSRHDLFSWPFIGWALKSMKGIPIVRGDRVQTRLACAQAVKALEAGRNIVIFPEGTWGDRQGTLQPFKKGIIGIARRASAIVVPITIMGSNLVNPPFSKEIHPGKLHMIVHSPMGPETWEGKTDDQWLEELRQTIASPFEEPDQLGMFSDIS